MQAKVRLNGSNVIPKASGLFWAFLFQEKKMVHTEQPAAQYNTYEAWNKTHWIK